VEPAFGSQLCETCAAPAEDGGVGTSTSSTDGMDGALSMAGILEDGLSLQFEGLHSWRRVELATKILCTL
jgi:hypothetical protein